MKRSVLGQLPTLVAARLLLWDAVARTATNGGADVAYRTKLTFAHHVRAPLDCGQAEKGQQNKFKFHGDFGSLGVG
jgi:hypothetical protein